MLVLRSSLFALLAIAMVNSSALADREQVREGRFDIEDGAQLVIDVPDGDVVIRSGTAGQVEMEVFVESRNMDAALERFERMDFQVDNGPKKIDISAREARGWSQRWKHDWRGGFGVSIELKIPKDMKVDIRTSDGNVHIANHAADISIYTSDGNVTLRDLQAKSLRIDTSDGNVRLGTVQAAEIDVATSDGDIRANHLEADQILLRSSDGSIDIETLSGAVEAKTGDGDIAVGFERAADTYLRTGDGDISLYAPSNLSAELDLRGDEVSLGRREMRFDGDITSVMARGKLNDGGPKLRAKSNGGTVMLMTRR